MTTSEAILELQNIQRYNYMLAPDEMFEMAINALILQERIAHCFDCKRAEWYKTNGKISCRCTIGLSYDYCSDEERGNDA